MKFSDIVKKNKSNIAFIVGNGINRFNSNNSNNSWEQLLIELWNKHSRFTKSEVPKGISLTEFYDVIELQHQERTVSSSLQKEFCDLLKNWSPSDHHKVFITWAILNNSPVLTTNFDDTLSKTYNCKLYRFSNKKFVYFYPWESYYSTKKITSPINNFAIWHINGMTIYPHSIRLGLTHYMGSVERARYWLHKGYESSSFSGKNNENWLGADTWLHILFNQPIAIFGLALEQNEVFLRWLLIERAKYFSKYPQRKKDAWYIYASEQPKVGKIIFLESLGITPIKVNTYEEIYIDPWKSS